MDLLYRYSDYGYFPSTILKGFQRESAIFLTFLRTFKFIYDFIIWEGIVQIVNNVEIAHINVLDVVYFVLVVSLFMVYTLHYKKSLNYERDDATGFASAYLHLALIFTLDFIFLIMNKVLANHEISTVELYIYTLAFGIFLLAIYIDTQLHNSVIDQRALFITIILIATIIGLIITNIYLVTIVEIIGILLLCFIFYSGKRDDEIGIK